MFTSWLTRRGRLPRLGRWPRLAIAGSCLLLAAGSELSARAGARAARTGTPVVIATRALAVGRVLTPSDVAVARWPGPLRPAGVPARLADVVGRRLSGPVTAHEPVTVARLLGRDATTGLTAGTVAVPVQVPDPHVADLVHAGDRVDLLTSSSSEDLPATGMDQTDGAYSGMGEGAGAEAGTVAASYVRVISVLPLRDGAGTEFVIATDTVTAQRIVRLAATQTLAAVAVPP